jgi:hypothetical protein
LSTLIDRSSLPNNITHPIKATLTAARASFERGNITSALHQLAAVQNKIQAQLDPVIASDLNHAS